MEPSTCIEAEPFALRVTDDSMAPEFHEGCVIIVDPTGHARDGAFVLAEHEGGYIFRQLRIDGEAVRLQAVKALGAERCLYGTDGPYAHASQSKTLQAIVRLPLTDGEKERILGRNFTDLIGYQV